MRNRQQNEDSRGYRGKDPEADGRQEEYTAESLHEERRYGLFWYSALWRVLRPVMVGVCVLAVVIGVAMSCWNWIDSHFLAPVDAQNETLQPFTVASGASLTRVSNDLEAQGLIHNRTVFKYYADFLGYGQKIQAGEYQLSASMRMTDIMEQLTLGDGNPIVRNITVIPGWDVEDIADYLVSCGALKDRQEFLSLCRTGTDYAAWYYVADVLSTGKPSQRRYVLEGYLMPDTYEVYTDATAGDIIKKLLSQTEVVFTDAWHDRAGELGMSMDQVLTLASMIEKEAKTGDFAKVSAVFHNRLRADMTMGSDVTVQYAAGVTRLVLTGSDLNYPSPYNTYLNKGLPLGPICSPSAAAIQAALYPDNEYTAQNYLYFCAKDPETGELYFSRTLEEHEQAVAIYSPLWQAFDQKQEQKQ